MNKIILIGRTTKEMELRNTQNGKQYVMFTLAVPKKMEKDKTDFISCVAWGKTAEALSKFVTKGTKIATSGYLNTRTYEKDGEKKYITEVIVEEFYFVESKNQKNEPAEASESYPEPF